MTCLFSEDASNTCTSLNHAIPGITVAKQLLMLELTETLNEIVAMALYYTVEQLASS